MSDTLKRKIYKLTHWEFWDWHFFYIPIYIYYLFLSFKARSFTFFTALNPTMEMGGLLAYSKKKIFEQLHEDYLIKYIFFDKKLDGQNINIFLEKLPLSYPIVAKPDKGERGKEVQKINTKSELYHYLKQTKHDIILQDYITYPIELGILYYYNSKNKKYSISSVVQKSFFSVVGNGKDSILTLLSKDPRKYLYIPKLKANKNIDLAEVLDIGEEKILEPIGNHRLGTTFINANHLINQKLIDIFEEISRPLKSFYFGRFDIKVKTLSDLYEGKNIKIIELNGANSEPAHIYDPKMSLLKAYKDLFQNWYTIYEISRVNHEKGVPYLSFKETVMSVYLHLYSHKNSR